MTQAKVILERAAALKFPPFIAAGASYQGEGPWRRFAEVPGYQPGLLARLETAEAERDRSAALGERDAERDADRAEAGTYDPDLAAAPLREAAEASERHEAGRPARIEALLERIADALEKRRA